MATTFLDLQEWVESLPAEERAERERRGKEMERTVREASAALERRLRAEPGRKSRRAEKASLKRFYRDPGNSWAHKAYD